MVDPTGRLAGRGAYVCRTAACLDKAITKGALSRALRTPLPADLRTSLAGSITDHTTEGGARGQE
jgi:Predicted nucleic-acid-binding protein implicated in transcription termination